MFLSLQRDIDFIFANAIKNGVFPGAVVGISKVFFNEIKPFVFSYGNAAVFPQPVILKRNFFFDLASLTKPLATTLAFLCLTKEKKLFLEDKICCFFDVYVPENKRNIKIKHLLNHCSGYPAHRPYYKKLIKIPEKERKKTIISWLMEEPLEYKTGEKNIYSDLGFMLLGFIVEKVSGKKLDVFVKEKIFNPMGLGEDIFYRPVGDDRLTNKNFVATEECLWRKKYLCGEVHDDNAYAMGGVAGHSGLFGNIEGVLALTTLFLDQWHERKNHPNYNNKDLRDFVKRSGMVKSSTWGLGFDTPAEKNSSGGQYLSKESFGHLGFTGTSFWIDPEKDLVMVLLTNRVHPNRENPKIKDFRPFFHDTVIKNI